LAPRHTVTAVGALITVVIGIVVTLAVWVVLFIGLAWLRPDGSTLHDAARIVPDTVRLVHRLAGDPAPWTRKYASDCSSCSPTSRSRSTSCLTSSPSSDTQTTSSSSVSSFEVCDATRRRGGRSPTLARKPGGLHRDHATLPATRTTRRSMTTRLAGSDERGWTQSSRHHKRRAWSRSRTPQLHPFGIAAAGLGGWRSGASFRADAAEAIHLVPG
jgi:hypothetical protein